MIGGLLIAVACGVLVEQPGVIWADGSALQGATIQIDDAGKYAVWAKTAPGEPGTVKLGDKTLSVEAIASDSQNGAQWISLSSHRLAAGDLTIDVSGPVVAVAMATHAAFDPQSAESLMYAAPIGTLPRDARLDLIRDTDTVFAMTPFDSRDDWELLAGDLRRKILVGSGLWPLPVRTPLNAVVEDVAEHDDYIVSRVHFEAVPGFHVTGNLFRPRGDGPFPGVICPHGHWENGRLEHGERGSVPARGITLARMGMVAFTYDMLGYNDSRQIHHRFEDQSETEQQRLELWGIHPFALQLWSSIRAVDFIQDLPYVDSENIACTGASGGGTQTFALTAVDDRIKVAAPVNMISHTMQGGCICENSPLIRLRVSNMEVGALAAPRPMMMVSATGDWTKKTPQVEYPAIRGIYDLYDAADRVANVHVDAGHNYNQQSREAVYRFFGKWVLDAGSKWKDFSEPEAIPESVEIARVFPEDANLEPGKNILAQMVMERRERSARVMPGEKALVDGFRKGYGQSLFDVTGVIIPDGNAVTGQLVETIDRPAHRIERLVLRHAGSVIPATLIQPTAKPRGSVLIVHSEGKAALMDIARDEPGALVDALVDDRLAVLAIDAFRTGECLATGGDRKIGKFPTTFLPTDTGYRIQDIVTALSYLKSRDALGGVTGLVGIADAGVWSMFASALDGSVPTTVVDANGFDTDDDAAWTNRHHLACVRSVGDVNTAAAMIAPRTLTVFNTQDVFQLSDRVFTLGNELRVDRDVWPAQRIVDSL